MSLKPDWATDAEWQKALAKARRRYDRRAWRYRLFRRIFRGETP